jgi:hypothetical protein
MTKRTDPNWEFAGLAPPRRLGALLGEVRTASGASLDELATRSSGTWTAEQLASAELGGVELDDARLQQVADLYGVDVADIVPARSRLVVDLDEGILRMDGRRTATEIGDGADRHEVLARYLALVYSMRRVPPGTEITLRVDDLDVLGKCLRVGQRALVADLDSLMGNPDDLVGWRMRLLRRKVMIPAVGILVSFCGAAALIMVSGEPATASPSPHQQAAVTASTVPQAEIGTAIVQERGPDGTPGPVVVRNG